MKLMTKAIEKSLPLKADAEDPLVRVKFFDAMSHWTWYATEYDPSNQVFFGWVDGDEPELGYFSLNEFEEINKTGAFPRIERDLYFKATPLSEVKKK